MFNLKTIPKDAAAEHLRYIAEHEEFDSVEELSCAGVTPKMVKDLLGELAVYLEQQAASEHQRYDVKGCQTLSKKSKDVISCLSSREEQSLLSIFGLVDKKAL